MSILTAACVVIAIIPLLSILYTVIINGISAVNLDFLTQIPKPVGEAGGGLGNAIQGTFIVVGIACLIGLPIGILAGVYLSEYGQNRFGRTVSFVADVLTGTPSIVAGMFGYTFIVLHFGSFSALAGGVGMCPYSDYLDSYFKYWSEVCYQKKIWNVKRSLNMQNKIIVENLNAWFGSKQVLHEINLGIEKNGITAIIGPSGCGKSTFIRCINRMHEVVPKAKVSGKVLVDDMDIYNSDIDPVDIRRRIGMVFQKPNPFPTMSIRDNVVAGLKLSGVKDKKKLDYIAGESLKKAALWDEVKNDLNKSGASLSGGQQQRLCIARALAVEPDVILFDEPCSALDPISTSKIEDLMMELKEKYTLVIVTHNMQQAARVSDHTAFFLYGKLIEFGETNQIFKKPKEKSTEDYIVGRFG